MRLRCNNYWIASLFLIGSAFGQHHDGDPFSGTWLLDSNKSVKWILASQAEQIHLKVIDGGVTKSEYECNTLGKECSIKDEGHNAMVSFWFNGPKLVEMKTHGSSILKRRFTSDQDGKRLQVELIPVMPQGQTEKLAFSREQ